MTRRRFFSLIFQGDIHPSTEKKIIPASEYSKLLSAQEIIEKAEEDRKELLEQTRIECEQLRERAKEEGHNEGLLAFNAHIVHFEQQLKKLRHETQQTMLPLVLQATKKVVGKQLAVKPETIVDIVIQTLSPVIQSKNITLFINKADREILEKEKPHIKEIFDQLESFTIHERDDIEPGGCIIETETGIINATLENQWRAIEAAFEKYIKSHEQ